MYHSVCALADRQCSIVQYVHSQAAALLFTHTHSMSSAKPFPGVEVNLKRMLRKTSERLETLRGHKDRATETNIRCQEIVSKVMNVAQLWTFYLLFLCLLFKQFVPPSPPSSSFLFFPSLLPSCSFLSPSLASSSSLLSPSLLPSPSCSLCLLGKQHNHCYLCDS